MKCLFNIIKALALILVAGLLYGLPASAQQTATLGKGPILVRLCPVSCIAVNGHGLKAGREVEVFETRSGWIRVSRFLNRRRLTKTFGQTITREPAL